MPTPPKPPTWATYIPSRSPKWKFHTSRAWAHNALDMGWTASKACTMWEWKDGNYQLVVETVIPKYCAVCDTKFEKTRLGHLKDTQTLLGMDNSKPKWEQPTVCRPCMERFFLQKVYGKPPSEDYFEYLGNPLAIEQARNLNKPQLFMLP